MMLSQTLANANDGIKRQSSIFDLHHHQRDVVELGGVTAWLPIASVMWRRYRECLRPDGFGRLAAAHGRFLNGRCYIVDDQHTQVFVLGVDG